MRRKVLLMGRKDSGKTSMRSIIFANYQARDCKRMPMTIDVETSSVRFVVSLISIRCSSIRVSFHRFLGDMILNLWDCGGQDNFFDVHLANREFTFANVEVLIHVFDATSPTVEKDQTDFAKCMEQLSTFSPNAKIFCLINKMDMIPEGTRKSLFNQREKELHELSQKYNFVCECFPTSIWHETLYKAWSTIVHRLIAHIDVYEKNLKQLADAIEADDVILFEKMTFLVIAACERKKQSCPLRYEKISNIIKQFKLSCSKKVLSMKSMQIRQDTFIAHIDSFTKNTFIVAVVSDLSMSSAILALNIKSASKHFQALEDEVKKEPASTPLGGKIITG